MPVRGKVEARAEANKAKVEVAASKYHDIRPRAPHRTDARCAAHVAKMRTARLAPSSAVLGLSVRT